MFYKDINDPQTSPQSDLVLFGIFRSSEKWKKSGADGCTVALQQ